MKIEKKLKTYFEKINKLDYYEIESEEDSWFLHNLHKAEKMTLELREACDLAFEYFVLGTNYNGSYLILNELNEILMYNIIEDKLNEFSISIDDILRMKE